MSDAFESWHVTWGTKGWCTAATAQRNAMHSHRDQSHPNEVKSILCLGAETPSQQVSLGTLAPWAALSLGCARAPQEVCQAGGIP